MISLILDYSRNKPYKTIIKFHILTIVTCVHNKSNITSKWRYFAHTKLSLSYKQEQKESSLIYIVQTSKLTSMSTTLLSYHIIVNVSEYKEISLCLQTKGAILSIDLGRCLGSMVGHLYVNQAHTLMV